METSVTEESTAKLALPLGRVVSFATITAAGFVLGQISGLAREMVVSASFGLSAELDAYFIARLVPTLINNIVAGSAITAAVMPVFARYLTEASSQGGRSFESDSNLPRDDASQGRRAEFWYVASVITNFVLLVTGALTVLGILLAAPIISILGMGLPPSTQVVAATLLVIMMPTLVLSALLNMVTASLNSVDRFIGPALIFLALNGGIIGTVLVLSPQIGIYSVALGFLLGVIFQLLVQSFELRHEYARYSFKIDLHHPALREVAIGFLPITVLALVSQINLAIDLSMAADLPTGSVGALSYANTILGSFYSLGISLGIAVFPSLSRMAAANDLKNTGRTVMAALRLLVFILVPLTFLLIAFPIPVVGVILERGRFDASDVQMTSQALAMYAIGLTAVGAMYVLQRAFYALSDGTTPLVVGSLVVILHVALNLALLPFMAHAGIALSASITAILGAAVLIVLLARRVGAFVRPLIGSMAQCTALSGLTALVAWGLALWLRVGTTTFADRLISITLAGAAGIAYFLLAWALRMPEVQMLLQTVSKIRPRATFRKTQ
jgi:putative peptidoglycan lipid II flippase